MICCSVRLPFCDPRRLAMLRLLAIRLVGMGAVVAAAAALLTAVVAELLGTAVMVSVFPPVPVLIFRGLERIPVATLAGIVMVADVDVVEVGDDGSGSEPGSLTIWPSGDELDGLAAVGTVGVGAAIGVTVIKLRCVAKRVAILDILIRTVKNWKAKFDDTFS